MKWTISRNHSVSALSRFNQCCLFLHSCDSCDSWFTSSLIPCFRLVIPLSFGWLADDLEQLLDNVVRRDAVAFRAKTRRQAMPKDGTRDVADVFRRDVHAAVEQRVGLAAEQQGLAR